MQNTTGLDTIYIINERGILTDSINNIYQYSSERFKVFEGNHGEFKAIVSTTAGMSIYKLPGTIPCNSCYDPLGLAKNDDNNKANKIESLPIPNPSKDEVKITFTLPDGVAKANLSIYTTNGQLVKTNDVDNRFGFILLDNSALPSGLYFYNIEVNGFVSSSQKIVVVK